jgi:hypothetical protein
LSTGPATPQEDTKDFKDTKDLQCPELSSLMSLQGSFSAKPYPTSPSTTALLPCTAIL